MRARYRGLTAGPNSTTRSEAGSRSTRARRRRRGWQTPTSARSRTTVSSSRLVATSCSRRRSEVSQSTTSSTRTRRFRGDQSSHPVSRSAFGEGPRTSRAALMRRRGDGGGGNWRLVLGETERARRLGVAVTIVAVMMRTNYDGLPAIARVAAAHGAAFRVNVYQAVKTDAFSLTYDQFWTGFRLLLEACPLAVCSEPLVRAVLGFGPRAEGCGCATVRITPRGEVLPCVYWPKRSLTLADLERLGPAVLRSAAFAEVDTLPEGCRGCTLVDVCHGGCASRRLLRRGLELPDEFCPFVNGRPLPSLPVHPGSARDFPKVGSACTSVFTNPD